MLRKCHASVRQAVAGSQIARAAATFEF